MMDRPILFSAPMVRALLAGTKTQTRRVIKPRSHASLFDGGWTDGYVLDPGNADWRARDVRFAVGDRLWVREAWRTSKVADELKPSHLVGGGYSRIWHEADRDNCDAHGKLRPGMFMPRWASRLTLTVTDVRVERLQDISEADAIAEGVVWQEPTDEDQAWAKARADEDGGSPDIDGVWTVPGMGGLGKTDIWGVTPQQSYQFLWNAINGQGAWDANPWVVAVSFSVEKRNIDQVPA